MQKIFTYLFFLITLNSLISCSKFDAEEPVPAYIYIDSFIISDSNLVGSSKSQAIKDVWVTAGNEFSRVHELPAIIPIIYTPGQKINVYLETGIHRDGMQNAHIIYPFFEPHYTVHEFQPGQIDTMQPVIEYKSTQKLNILLETDFEEDDIPFEALTGYDGEIEKISGVNVFEGNHSGGIFVNNNQQDLIMVSKEKFEFGVSGKVVYLEIDYKSNTYLSIGSIITTETGSQSAMDRFITLKPTNGEWKKVYVNLSRNFTGFTTNEYQLLLASIQEEGSVPNGEIYIDNLKLLREQ